MRISNSNIYIDEISIKALCWIQTTLGRYPMASCSTSPIYIHDHRIVAEIREAIASENFSALPALFHTCMVEYREGKLDRQCYNAVVSHLGTHPACKAIYDKVILGISPAIEGSPDRSSSYLENLCTMAYDTTRYLAEQIYNYNHPWKVQKYTLVLEELKNNLGKIYINPQVLKSRFGSPMTHLHADVCEIVDTIFNPKPEEYPSDRERYQIGFVQKLRTILEHPELLPKASVKLTPVAYVIHWLVLYRYLHVHLFEWQRQLVKKFIVEGRRVLFYRFRIDQSEADREDSLKLPLEWQYKAIEAAPKWLKARPVDLQIGKFQGHIGLGFDPGGRNNLASGGWQWGLLINIRMATPTIQPISTTDQTTIAPEFAYFIHSIKLQRETILYINLQINFSEGAEKSRTNQLKILQNQQPKTFLLAMFDMDSPFYHQKYDPTIVIPLTSFCQSFFDHLTSQCGPYQLLDLTEDMIWNLFDAIKNTLFPFHSTVTIHERKIYIDFFHALAVITLIQNNQPNYFTTVCKDGLDRAGTVNALVRVLIMLREEQDMDPLSQMINVVGIHAPPIMAKKIAMLPERRSRYLAILDLLDDPQVRERVRAMLKEKFISRGPITVTVKLEQTLLDLQ